MRGLLVNRFLIICTVLSVMFYGCVDDEFDSPTPLTVPTANTTIAEVIDMFTSGTVIVQDDLVIKGSVISSDILGNIFKTMYIQDETGTIALRTEVGNTSVDFPFGTEAVVKLQGLTLSTFSGLKQIGFASVNYREHIFNNRTQVEITPVRMAISDIKADMAPMLVELSDVQFELQNMTFANPDGDGGVDRIVMDCDGNFVIMRNSDFSDNAGTIMPAGNGTIVALLSRFGATPQLLLNFESDLNLNNERCSIPEPNTTISELKSMFINGQTVRVTEDVIIKATVISSDELGNIFETLYLRDETGSITVDVEDQRDIYEIAPYGAEIVLNLNGLSLSFDNNLAKVFGITEDNFRGKIIRTGIITSPQPELKNIGDLSFDDIPGLIQLENVEFADLNTTFASSDNSENRDIMDCDGNTIIMRNSSFAANATEFMPEGNGTVVAVLSRYRDDIQLFLNFESDLTMEGLRCDSGTGEETAISIAELRSLFNNGTAIAPDDRKISAVVISDRTNGMITDRNVIVQEPGGSGIVLRFPANNILNLNDEIEVVVTGGSMSEFNGLLQLEVTNARATVTGTGSIAANRKTIAEIKTDFENLESTLVEVINPAFSGNTVFNGDVTVVDDTGEIGMFTRNAASFSAQRLPEKADAMIAIVTQGGVEEAQQVTLRSYEEITNPVIGMGGGAAEIPFAESFNSGIPFNWTTAITTGDRVWEGDDFDDVFYVNMSAFAGAGNPGADVVTWLITPEFDFDLQAGETMELRIADAFQNGNPLRVMYSTDYTGIGNPNLANWIEVGASQIAPLINNSDTYDNNYESTGDLDLSGITGTGYIAFVYNSAGGNITTTIQISDVIIQ